MTDPLVMEQLLLHVCRLALASVSRTSSFHLFVHIMILEPCTAAKDGLAHANLVRRVIDCKESPRKELPELGEKVRKAMQRVPHAVAVVTPSSSDRDGPPATDNQSPLDLGLIISSFNTVTLEPDPVVSFNVKLPSRTYEAILQCGGYFEISPLWEQLATRFINAPKAPMFDKNGQRNSKSLLPSYSRLHRGRMFGLKCQLLERKTVNIEDHLILVGKVIKLIDGRGPNVAKRALVHRLQTYGRVEAIGE